MNDDPDRRSRFFARAFLFIAEFWWCWWAAFLYDLRWGAPAGSRLERWLIPLERSAEARHLAAITRALQAEGGAQRQGGGVRGD